MHTVHTYRDIADHVHITPAGPSRHLRWPPYLLLSFGCWPQPSLAAMVHDAQTASERASARPALVAVPLFQGLLGPRWCRFSSHLQPPQHLTLPFRTAAASQRRVPISSHTHRASSPELCARAASLLDPSDDVCDHSLTRADNHLPNPASARQSDLAAAYA